MNFWLNAAVRPFASPAPPAFTASVRFYEQTCRYLNAAGRQLGSAACAVLRHREVRGYAQLPWFSRCQLNALSFVGFLCSVACLRVLCASITWLLVSYIIVWTNDLRGPAAAALPSAALLWLLPWLAQIRRRNIVALLDGLRGCR